MCFTLFGHNRADQLVDRLFVQLAAALLLRLLVGTLAVRLPATLAAATAVLQVVFLRVVRRVLYRLLGDDHTAATTALARLGVGLKQTIAELLAGQLHQAERGDLGDLVAGAITAQRFLQATQHQLLVFIQDHVNEVDDHHAADVAQAQLADDFLRGLQIVRGDRLLEVAAGASEFAGVDVNHRHGLGALNNERAARRQPHHAGKRLLDLLVDAVLRKGVGTVVFGAVKLGHAVQQVRRDGLQVSVRNVVGLLAVDDQLREVLVEDVADDADDQARLFVEQHRARALPVLRGFCLFLHHFPLFVQALDVLSNRFLRHALGSRTNNRPTLARHNLVEDALEALAFGDGQLAGDPSVTATRHVHEETSGQRNVRCQASTLVPVNILRDLHHHLVAGLQRVLNPALLSAKLRSLPVNLAGVEHRVAPGSDVDERRLHARQHVLDTAHVNIADDRRVIVRGHKVLRKQPVFQDRYLRDAAWAVVAVALAHHHRAVHRLAPREEFRLRNNAGALALRFSTLTPPTTLRLQTGGTADPLRLVNNLDLRFFLFGLLNFTLRCGILIRFLRFGGAHCSAALWTRRRLEDRRVFDRCFLFRFGLRVLRRLRFRLWCWFLLWFLLRLVGGLQCGVDFLLDLVDLVFYVLAHPLADLFVAAILRLFRLSLVRGLLQRIDDLLGFLPSNRGLRNLCNPQLGQRHHNVFRRHPQRLRELEHPHLVFQG